jgi:hypothetical protein
MFGGKMDLQIRKLSVVTEDYLEVAGQPAHPPLHRSAVIAVVANPCVGQYQSDLSEMIEASGKLGKVMAERLIAVFGAGEVQSYGKAAVVGGAGEQEHANALISTTFAEPFRAVIGGGRAWISSVTKVAPIGTLVDVPMNHKDEVYVRSHYDAMQISLADAPRSDEIAVIFAIASRGRVNARVGGLSHEEVAARHANNA